MKTFIDYSTPDKNFWENYRQLWENSAGKPAFQAPRVLQYFAEKSPTPVAIYKFYVGVRLKGAALFHKRGNAYSFLSDMKTDHNSFVIHQDCTASEIKAFFECFHAEIKKEKWTMVLNNQPMWAPYMDIFVRAGASSNLFWHSSKSSVCPMLVKPTPEAIFETLSKSRNNRYKLNRLQREHQVAFEALRDEEDLENWTTEFCESHTRRWADTATPSKYRNPERRAFLFECLKAWHKDGILVRFSLKVDGKRVAFVIGLMQEKNLIYHALTHDSDYNRHSPSLLLVMFLGEWMKENGFNVLDFGDGNESYKYNFANEEGQLNSIFIGARDNLPFILQSHAISAVRSKPALIQFYREKVRPFAMRLFF